MKKRTAIAAPFIMAINVSICCASLPIFFPLQFFDICLDVYEFVRDFKSFFLEVESSVHVGESDCQEEKDDNCDHGEFLFFWKMDWCYEGDKNCDEGYCQGDDTILCHVFPLLVWFIRICMV